MESKTVQINHERPSYIRPWLGVFANAEQEKRYQEHQWPNALVKYRIMAIIGFLMSFGDPTVYTRGTIEAFVEAIINTAFLAIPFLLRNQLWFRKYHPVISGTAARVTSCFCNVYRYSDDGEFSSFTTGHLFDVSPFGSYTCLYYFSCRGENFGIFVNIYYRCSLYFGACV